MSAVEPEPIAGVTATDTHVNGPEEIFDSQSESSLPYQSSQWWTRASTVSYKSVTDSERNALDQVSLLGRFCVITVDPGEVQLAHLIPKATNIIKIRQYQYSFGRKLDLNSRWFTLYLRADWHGMFDKIPNGWALIPTPSLITQIATKMRAEKERRLPLEITGPWPDFRGSDWFPTIKSGYTYHFTPLGLAHSGRKAPIVRMKDAADPDSGWETYPAPYDTFPLLQLHIHPYAAILNAFPKLEKHLTSGKPLPTPANTSYPELKFIHNVLTRAYKEAKAVMPPAQGSRHSSRNSGTGTSTNTSKPSRSSRSHARTKSQRTNQGTSNSGLGSAREGGYDDLFERLDEDAERLYDGFDVVSRELLSNSTPSHSDVPPKDVNYVPSHTPPLFAASEWGKVAKWVAGVEYARSHGALLEPQDDSSPEATQYAEELARPPRTLDWHEWTSDFAPWWVLLPERKKRGILSSNDWVVIWNLPSLTGQLDRDAAV
ncbi:unnamed protein product [Rhizoctonia solani]|uniref:HNH nuclease domain-containing protein n=1 Tax=Rhizoctonia solani TaxID=456999 RepID=A0A8H3HIZ0_9AGAM|nr:unnamed protein product [Rhizoctonia solani]